MGSVRLIKKDDYPSLLSPGVHSISREQLFSVTGHSEHRKHMHTSLNHWMDGLLERGISGKLWFMGSFMTQKSDPNDIDVVFWAPIVDRPASRDIDPWKILNPAYCLESFKIDLHVEPFDNDLLLFRESHYLGFFGYANDRRTPRGIAEVSIGD